MTGSVSGGRFLTGSGAARSPPRARCPKGRYHTSDGLAASDRPMRSASCGSSELVSVSTATSGAARSRATRSGMAAGSSTTMQLHAGVVSSAASRRPRRGLTARLLGRIARSGEASRQRVELSSLRRRTTRSRSGSAMVSWSRSNSTGTSRRNVTSSLEAAPHPPGQQRFARRLPLTSDACARTSRDRHSRR